MIQVREMRVDAAISILLNSRRRAGIATASLWACALLLSVLALQVVARWSVPVQDILQLLAVLPMAPTPLAFLPMKGLGWVFDRLAIDDGVVVPISVAIIWMGVVVGYWGGLGWLTWRAGIRQSRLAFVVLGALLTISSPLWLISIVWMGNF